MKGLIYIFTGEGKGKTSAALGMALRAVCDEKRVAWVAWYKDKSWKVSEFNAPKILGKRFTLYVEGKGFHLGTTDQTHVRRVNNIKVARVQKAVVVDTASLDEHKQAAKSALEIAERLLQEKQTDVLICDELCQAAGDGLVSVDEVIHLLNLRGSTHLVLTGRHCPQELIDLADTVSEVKKVKHAYDAGIMAVKGLDF